MDCVCWRSHVRRQSVWARRVAALTLVPMLLMAQDAVPTFGTTVYSNSGFTGQVYLLEPGTPRLPRFDKLTPKGSIYTNSLNVPQQDFREGFPGVTDRYEWFAINYAGTFWVENAAEYRFSLTSDDGSRLFIDGHEVINNDGVHAAITKTGRRHLKQGAHSIRVAYMQGPAMHVALVLEIAGPGQDFRVFDARDFRPASRLSDGGRIR